MTGFALPYVKMKISNFQRKSRLLSSLSFFVELFETNKMEYMTG